MTVLLQFDEPIMYIASQCASLFAPPASVLCIRIYSCGDRACVVACCLQHAVLAHMEHALHSAQHLLPATFKGFFWLI